MKREARDTDSGNGRSVYKWCLVGALGGILLLCIELYWESNTLRGHKTFDDKAIAAFNGLIFFGLPAAGLGVAVALIVRSLYLSRSASGEGSRDDSSENDERTVLDSD